MNSGAGFGNLLVLALPLLLLAFLMFSQRKRGREVQQLQAGLVVGDEVVLTSGLYGRIVRLDERVAVLEVAPGVEVRVDRRAVGMQAPTDPAGPNPSDRPDTPPR